MRVLFASLAFPFPPTNGHRIRNWILLRALHAEGHEVTLVTFAEPAEMALGPATLDGLCAATRLVPAPAPASASWRRALDRLRAAPSRLPYGVHRFRSPEMSRAIAEAAETAGVDCILCDDIYNFENVMAAARAPVLLNKHDLTHVIVGRYAEYTKNPLERAYARLEHSKLRRWEGHTSRYVPGVLACSDVDRRTLHALAPGSRIEVVPNAIDVDAYPPRPAPDGGAPVVLYFGSMDWYPNVDAVEYFAGDILPELQRLVPGVAFRVAGRNPPRRLRERLAGLGAVEFTGTVDDIRDAIASATVCVVPLRIGSGTRLKILEAGAMEKAIVSTRIGAEGLDLEHGRDILLVDEPVPFASAIAELLRDPARRRHLGQAARQRVAREYSLPAVQMALRAALPALLRPWADAPPGP